MKKFIFMMGISCFFSVFSSDFKKLALRENSAFRSLSEEEKSVWVSLGFTGDKKEFAFKYNKKEEYDLKYQKIAEYSKEIIEETERYIQLVKKEMGITLTLVEIAQFQRSKLAERGISVITVNQNGEFSLI